MALHCPKCGSSRVRHGYARPPLFLRIIGIHELLCDNCNLSYRSFALPGTVPKHPRRRPRPDKNQQTAPKQKVASSFEREEKMVYADHGGMQGGGVTATEVVSFLKYYVSLRIKVPLGLYHTTHPLNLRYRWRNWQRWRRSRRF